MAWRVLWALVWVFGGGSTWQVTNNISVTLATSPAKASARPALAPLSSSQKKTLGAKVKSPKLHRVCGEAPAPTGVRLALPEPHGWDGQELSPSSCHLIPDTILSPAHSRDIHPPQENPPRTPTRRVWAVFQAWNAASHPKPRGDTAAVTPQGCLVVSGASLSALDRTFLPEEAFSGYF